MNQNESKGVDVDQKYEFLAKFDSFSRGIKQTISCYAIASEWFDSCHINEIIGGSLLITSLILPAKNLSYLLVILVP